MGGRLVTFRFVSHFVLTVLIGIGLIVGQVYVNQSGYDRGAPKRFTAPGVSNTTRFYVVRSSAPADTTPFAGWIRGELGDFTAFNPADTGEFFVRLSTGPQSVRFSIGPNWLTKSSAKLALDFLVDARCDIGCNASCLTGIMFRDDHQFSFEIPTLVNLFFSNPSLWTRYSTEIAPTNSPDIIDLIQWAANTIVTKNCEHTLLKAQLAYYLFAYPWMRPYASPATYQLVRDYAFARWQNDIRNCNYYDIPHSANLLLVKTEIGTEKGQFPPGATVVPNLMMFEVAKREGRADSLAYFQAAYDQTQWMITSLNWNDSVITKGQRMSEHVTLEGLSYFQEKYPNRAPPGLKTKIEQWAHVMAGRSNNLWDFRKYSPGRWTVFGLVLGTEPNEPGNVAGFPAPAFSASRVLNPGLVLDSLNIMAYSHIDNFFGRNPLGRHFSFKASTYWPGVESGWFSEYAGGNGRLQCVRGVIDGSPKNSAYPYNPADTSGYTEGWVAFNTAWASSLAYLAGRTIQIQAWDSLFIDTLQTLGRVTALGVRLRADLDLNYSRTDSALIQVVVSSGDSENIVLRETAVMGGVFQAKLPVAWAAPSPGDGRIQVQEGDRVSISYGLDIFRRTALLVATTNTRILPKHELCGPLLGNCRTDRFQSFNLQGRKIRPIRNTAKVESGLRFFRTQTLK